MSTDIHEGWQVFQWVDDEEIEIDGRDAGSFVYVGRIVKPLDAPSYWQVDEEVVGERFGEGHYMALSDKAVLEWNAPSIRTPPTIVLLDIVAEKRYLPR